MIKVSKCCVIFPLRPGCVAIGVIFTVLSLMGAINKLIEVTLFIKTARTSPLEHTYEDTRMSSYIQAKVIRYSFVLLLELLICSASVAFAVGILKERLSFLPPFIVHLALKVGYYIVHYFDSATKHIERDDNTGALRLYIFGIIISCIFGYLCLCTYCAFLELKAKKDFRVMTSGIENPQMVSLHL